MNPVCAVTAISWWTFWTAVSWAAGPEAGSVKSASYEEVCIQGVPHIAQKPDFCGEACAAMYLQKLGYAYDQDAVYDRSGLDPLKGRGCVTRELNRALLNIGFRTGMVWRRINARDAAASLEKQWAALHSDLARGIPSIVCMRTGEGQNTTEHFRLVLGYRAKSDEVVYHEPAAVQGAYRRMQRRHFMRAWPLKYDAKEWTVIRFLLEPGTIRPAPKTAGFSPADFAQHVRTLKTRIPDDRFTVIVQEPFVVIGDEPPDRVRTRSEQTVKWATDRLKQGFFARDPADIIDIWLFKDKASYRKYTREIFGDDPDTPFGYSSSQHKALIMNIGTGGGTLVHEIVHPFVAANFPECPSWLNEGLGSLYEQCRDRNGRIWGLTNWRLAGLQEAIREGRVPSFEVLTGTSESEFYHQDSGTNYAQARYLCYYLQERGLLRTFYRKFASNHAADPGGYETLKRVLGEKDMAAFQRKWEAFVLKLKFP